ncbi:MAG: GNAT family N-acetyltransferase [Hyphomicrobium sp.]|nr:GNAT family N-acetyltransferase [Hyphomicrobium sp.]
MSSVPMCSIKTDRLLLRPSRGTDADRALEIQSDWDVTRMLSMASFPPDQQEMEQWFADHEREWRDGEAHRFAIEIGGNLIGLVDLDGLTESEAALGYWIERASWGRGYAYEAAQAVTRFGFAELGLSRIKAGHAYDNAASGRVLRKLGFVPLDIVERFSRPRGASIQQHRYVLTKPGNS